MSRLLPLAAVALLHGCGTARSAPEPAPAQEGPVDLIARAESNAAEAAWLTRVPAAATVAVGTLVDVGPPPGHWSGYERATQALTFDVHRVLRGELAPGRHTVHHVIVAGSPEVQADAPALSAAHTAVGTDYVLLLDAPQDGVLVTPGEGVAPRAATPALLAKVEAAL